MLSVPPNKISTCSNESDKRNNTKKNVKNRVSQQEF